MSLPLATTAEDVGFIVRYLRSKPTGATLAEAKAVLQKQVLDPRKITAYRAWNVVVLEGDKYKLSPLGGELARNPDSEPRVFRAILDDSMFPYRSALEWIYHQGFPSVSTVDVAAHWHDHHAKVLGTDNENTIKDNAVCFFHLCTAARLGTLTMGRNKKPTRLDLNKDELKAYVEAGPTVPPWTAPAIEPQPETPPYIQEPVKPQLPNIVLQPAPSPKNVDSEDMDRPFRTFIAHGKNMEIVEQVEAILGFANLESEVAEDEETTAIPVPVKVLDAMRRCQAAIIVVTVEEGRKDQHGNYALNENVLIEIGAAFVLYNQQVVLLWDKRLPVPSNVQGLYRCEFEGDNLSWPAGLKLMKAIKEFKA